MGSNELRTGEIPVHRPYCLVLSVAKALVYQPNWAIFKLSSVVVVALKMGNFSSCLSVHFLFVSLRVKLRVCELSQLVSKSNNFYFSSVEEF